MSGRICLLRFVNYDVIDQQNDHKREVVLLYHPFRNELIDITDGNKFLQIFEENHERLYEVTAKLQQLVKSIDEPTSTPRTRRSC